MERFAVELGYDGQYGIWPFEAGESVIAEPFIQLTNENLDYIDNLFIVPLLQTSEVSKDFKSLFSDDFSRRIWSLTDMQRKLHMTLVKRVAEIEMAKSREENCDVLSAQLEAATIFNDVISHITERMSNIVNVV